MGVNTGINRLAIKKTGLLFFFITALLMVASIVKAEDENIITLYISNSDMFATVGSTESKKPALYLAMEGSSHPKLLADPPSLVFNDSPLKFLHTFMEEHGAKIRDYILSPERGHLPIRLYIASPGLSGSSGAREQPAPKNNEGIRPYLNERNFICLQGDNKADFFLCMFSKKFEEYLEQHVSTKLEEDSQMMAEMAWNFTRSSVAGKSHNDKREVLLVHTTTCAVPHLVNEGEIQHRKQRWQYAGCHEGGPYEIGQNFKAECLAPISGLIEANYKDQTNFEEMLAKQKNNALACAVYSDKALHDFCYEKSPGSDVTLPRGAPYLFYRLVEKNKGFNLFGDKVRGVAFGLLPNTDKQSTSTPGDYSVKDASLHATSMLEHAAVDALLGIIMEYAFNEREAVFKNKGKLPVILLAGEKVDAIEHYVLASGSDYPTLLKQKLDDESFLHTFWLKAIKDRNPDFSVFKTWVRDNMVPLIKEIKILPHAEFSNHLHMAGLSRFENLWKKCMVADLDTPFVDMKKQ